jgi:hypothetical protein
MFQALFSAISLKFFAIFDLLQDINITEEIMSKLGRMYVQNVIVFIRNVLPIIK